MLLKIHPFELKFKHAFTISRMSKSTQHLLVTELVDGNLSGLGECTANSYYETSLSQLSEILERNREVIENTQLTNPEQYWNELYPFFKENMFALCALDIAAHDLYAQKQGKSLFELWDLDISKNPVTDYTIGIDTIDNMVNKLKEMPWPIYKIKLGTKEDIEIIRELRKHSTSLFRVDANCAWDVEETLNNAKELKKLGVEFIEQPMPAELNHKMPYLLKHADLPLIADESCIREEDVQFCAGKFHGINIKLSKCGGLTPALRMIKKARHLNLKVMIGSMSESTVGMSAAAHLLPLVDYADLDSPLLLAEDSAEGIKIENGKIIYANRTGTGAKLF